MTKEIWVGWVSGNVIYAKHTINLETLRKLLQKNITDDFPDCNNLLN